MLEMFYKRVVRFAFMAIRKKMSSSSNQISDFILHGFPDNYDNPRKIPKAEFIVCFLDNTNSNHHCIFCYLPIYFIIQQYIINTN